MTLRVNRMLADTTSEGPGHRFCVWMQGCSRHCPGCFARELWDPTGGEGLSLARLVAILDERLRREPALEGITLLGGEPFEQAAELVEFAAHARECGLSVFCFSGYTLEELRASTDACVTRLLAQVDVLADGPYLREQRSFERPWVGSSNQRFHFLTDRYDPEAFLRRRNSVEIRLRRDGSIAVNGMGSVFDLVSFGADAPREEGSAS